MCHDNSVGNTVKDSSSVFSLVRMNWLPLAKTCKQ